MDSVYVVEYKWLKGPRLLSTPEMLVCANSAQEAVDDVRQRLANLKGEYKIIEVYKVCRDWK